MNIIIDPEFKALIPPLAPEEYAQLEANILQDGCRDPLVLWEGIIIDGHNRFEICTKHGISFEKINKRFADRTGAMLWMIDNQKGRRNVSDYDKGLLAMRKQELLRPLAEKNKEGFGGNQHTGSLAKLPTNQTKIDTRKAAAQEAGIGERTLDAVKLIKDAADKGEIAPDVIQDLRHRKVAIHRVAKDIKEKRQRDDREKKRTEAAKEIAIPENLIIGDFRENADKLPDGSVSLIFTDPPYDKEAEKLFEGLADFAAAKLCEGGSLLMYLGHLQLPAAFSAFAGKLRHWWTCACVHEGDKALMREYGIRAGWKPMLWFVKQTRDDKSNIVFDVVSTAKEKDFHDWQQSQSEAEYYIKELCPPDGIVCDPFMGGGTTAAAAKAIGRKWVGFEINEATAKIASSRLV